MVTQSEDKRLKIINSAIKLFVERGFHGTSTNAISKDAGVSAGILFHYFPTKKQLIIDLFLSIKSEFYKVVFRDVDESDIESSIKRVWNSSINWGLENRYKFFFLSQYHNSPFYSEVKNNELIKNYDDYLSLLFRKGIETGLLMDINIELLKNNSYNLIVSFLEFYINENGNSGDFIEEGWLCFRASMFR